MTTADVAAPQAVLLDAGGVLVLPNPWVIGAVLRAAGGSITAGDVRRAHYAGIAAMDSRRTSDWSHYNRVLVRFAGVPDRCVDDALAGLAEIFAAPVTSTWNVVPEGVLEHLRDLAATGVAIAVVSNADGLVEETLRRCGIPVDLVIDSTIVGYAKPEPEIFGFALDKLNIAPSDAMHVGDMASADVDGAHAAGLRSLHLDPFGDCPYPAGHHEHVRSLADVVVIAAG
jgi:putative hydrolase of the HAD superfamily